VHPSHFWSPKRLESLQLLLRHRHQPYSPCPGCTPADQTDGPAPWQLSPFAVPLSGQARCSCSCTSVADQEVKHSEFLLVRPQRGTGPTSQAPATWPWRSRDWRRRKPSCATCCCSGRCAKYRVSSHIFYDFYCTGISAVGWKRRKPSCTTWCCSGRCAKRQQQQLACVSKSVSRLEAQEAELRQLLLQRQVRTTRNL